MCVFHLVGDRVGRSVPSSSRTPMTVSFLDHSNYKPLQLEPGDFRSFEACVKKFRKVVEKEGTLRRVVERKHFIKPSEKRRKAKIRGKLAAKRKAEEAKTKRGRTIPIHI